MMSDYTEREWHAEAVRRFGHDVTNWRFVCPACGHIASVRDYRDAGVCDKAVAYSCVGRWLPGSIDAFTVNEPGPCTYAGGGLHKLNPVTVLRTSGDIDDVFAFAEAAEAVDRTGE